MKFPFQALVFFSGQNRSDCTITMSGCCSARLIERSKGSVLALWWTYQQSFYAMCATFLCVSLWNNISVCYHLVMTSIAMGSHNHSWEHHRTKWAIELPRRAVSNQRVWTHFRAEPTWANCSHMLHIWDMNPNICPKKITQM